MGPADLQPLFWTCSPSNNNADAYLRQATVEGLSPRLPADPARSSNAFAAEAVPNAAVPAVRMGVVLALRKLRGAELAQFVTDGDPQVQAEAARAICDENISRRDAGPRRTERQSVAE